MLKHTLNFIQNKETSPLGANAHPESLLVEMPEDRRVVKTKKQLIEVKG